MHFCADRHSESAILYTAKPAIAPTRMRSKRTVAEAVPIQTATKLSTGKHRGADAYSCRFDRASAEWVRNIAATSSRA